MDALNLKTIFSGKTIFYMSVAGLGTCMLLAAIGLMLCVGLTFGTIGLFTGGVFLLGFAWLEMALQREQKHRKVLIFLRRFMLLTGIFILLSFAGVCYLVLSSLQTAGAVPSVPYAIVLGAGINGDQPSKTLARRLDAAADYMEEHPQTRLVVSGGLGRGKTMTEAAVMQQYLLQRGIASQKIILEEASTTSEENLRNTARILRELSGEEKPPLLIFTSDYHLYRAQILARPYYSAVYGIGAESPALVRINYMLREYLALFKMWGRQILEPMEAA